MVELNVALNMGLFCVFSSFSHFKYKLNKQNVDIVLWNRTRDYMFYSIASVRPLTQKQYIFRQKCSPRRFITSIKTKFVVVSKEDSPERNNTLSTLCAVVVAQLVERSLLIQRSAVRFQSSAKIYIKHFTANCIEKTK